MCQSTLRSSSMQAISSMCTYACDLLQERRSTNPHCVLAFYRKSLLASLLQILSYTLAAGSKHSCVRCLSPQWLRMWMTALSGTAKMQTYRFTQQICVQSKKVWQRMVHALNALFERTEGAGTIPHTNAPPLQAAPKKGAPCIPPKKLPLHRPRSPVTLTW